MKSKNKLRSWLTLIPLVAPVLLVSSCASNTSQVANAIAPTKLSKLRFTYQELNLPSSAVQARSDIDANWVLHKKTFLFTGALNLLTSSDQIMVSTAADYSSLRVVVTLVAGAFIDDQHNVGAQAQMFEFTITNFEPTTDAEQLSPTTLKFPDFPFGTLDLPPTVNQAQTEINSAWIITKRSQLFTGAIELLTKSDQVQHLQVVATNETQLTVNFVLQPKAFVNAQGQIAIQSGRFTFTISGFSESEAPEGFLDPMLYPELFSDAHAFDLKTLLAAPTTNAILQATNLYKYSLHNFKWFLKHYVNADGRSGIDFINNPFDRSMTEDFYQMLEHIGVYGDYKFNNDQELMQYTPQLFIDKYLLMQKYLPKPAALLNLKPTVPTPTITKRLNTVVQNNVFGFLPSNLAQLLYYMDRPSIARLFGLDTVADVSANFDDQIGTIDIFINDEQSRLHSFHFSYQILTNLKRTTDFKKFLFDRTFWIQGRFWEYAPRGLAGRNGYQFVEKTLAGTAWVLDRLPNPTLAAQNQYEFLVGTNMHVANISPYFEKNHVISNANYNQYWNGGFVNRANDGSSTLLDQITTHQVNQRQYDELNKASNRIARFQFGYHANRDYEQIEANYGSGVEARSWTDSVSLTSENYLDMIWYTPRFQSANVRAEKAGESEYLFGTGNYDPYSRSGTLHNAGIDFVVMKIILTREQISKMFPTLIPFLNTPNEREWYVGLGTDRLINPSDTFFSGGFPLGGWKTIQTNGGRIKTKNREVSRDTTQSYWTAYNAQENDYVNQFNFRKEAYRQPQRPDMAHGMRLEHIMQDSILHIHTVNGQYQNGGASGSMVIDSRFNVIGIIYNKVLPPDGNANDPEAPALTNSISLFRHHSQFPNWTGSVKQDVINKLRQTQLKSVKLNP